MIRMHFKDIGVPRSKTLTVEDPTFIPIPGDVVMVGFTSLYRVVDRMIQYSGADSAANANGISALRVKEITLYLEIVTCGPGESLYRDWRDL